MGPNFGPVLLVIILFCNKQIWGENEVYKKACIRETSINPLVVDKAYEGEFPDRKELKCFFRCYYLEFGFINEEGEVQIDVIRAKIPAKANRKQAYQAIDKCKNLKGTDSCDTAFKMQKCLYENDVIY